MAFADKVWTDWLYAMDSFFSAVDRKRSACNLTDKEVGEALDRGYGTEIAEAWAEWVGGDS